MVFVGKGFGTERKFQMTCEYCEGDRDMPAAASSYIDEAVDEIITIDRAEEYGDFYKNIVETYMADGRKEPKPITYCSFCGRKL